MDLQINKISSKEDEVRKTFSDAISYCTELLRRKKYYDDVENDTMSRQSALLGQKFFEILQNARNELLAEETKLNDKKTPISSRVSEKLKSQKLLKQHVVEISDSDDDDNVENNTTKVNDSGAGASTGTSAGASDDDDDDVVLVEAAAAADPAPLEQSLDEENKKNNTNDNNNNSHNISDDDYNCKDDDDNDEDYDNESDLDSSRGRKYRSLPYHMKVKVVELAEKHPLASVQQLQKLSGCNKVKSRQQIRDWANQIDNGGSLNDIRKKINDWVYEKCIEYQNKNKRITCDMIRKWGFESKKIIVKDRPYDFCASPSWLRRFQKKYNITGHQFNLKINNEDNSNNNNNKKSNDDKEKKSTNKKIDSTDKIKETVSKYFDSTYKQRAAVTKADKNSNNNVIEINDIADESVEDNLNNTLENLIDKNTDDVCTSNKNNTGNIVVQQVDKNSTGIIDNQIKQNSTGIINNQIEKESTGIIDDKIEKESTGIINHQIEKELTSIIDDKIEKESTGIINNHLEKESTSIINNQIGKESTGIINNQIVKESTGIINNQIVKESTDIINHQIEKKSTGIIDDKIAKNLTAVINEKIRETVNAMVNQDKENMCVKNTNINANCPDKNVAEKQDNTQHVNEKISLVNKDQAVTKQIVINENKQSPEQSNSINNNVVIKTEPVDCPDENDEVSSTMFKSPTVPPLVPVTTEDGLRKIKKELVSSTSDNEFYSNRTIITRKSISKMPRAIPINKMPRAIPINKPPPAIPINKMPPAIPVNKISLEIANKIPVEIPVNKTLVGVPVNKIPVGIPINEAVVTKTPDKFTRITSTDKKIPDVDQSTIRRTRSASKESIANNSNLEINQSIVTDITPKKTTTTTTTTANVITTRSSVKRRISEVLNNHEENNTPRKSARKNIVINQDIIIKTEKECESSERDSSVDSKKFHISLDEKKRVLAIANKLNLNERDDIDKLIKESQCKCLKNYEQLQSWRRHVRDGGTRNEKIKKISDWIYDRCVEYKKQNYTITQKIIKGWALEAKRVLAVRHLDDFHAPDLWIHRFKRKHNITGPLHDLKLHDNSNAK